MSLSLYDPQKKVFIQCKTCKSVFTNKQFFTYHHCKLGSKGLYYCDVCDKNLKGLPGWTYHITTTKKHAYLSKKNNNLI